MGTQLKNTSTGLKIGTAASQKVGVFGATPVVQPSGATQAAATDAASVIVLANKLRTDLVALGVIKGSA